MNGRGTKKERRERQRKRESEREKDVVADGFNRMHMDLGGQTGGGSWQC